MIVHGRAVLESVSFWVVALLAVAAILQVWTGWASGDALDVVLRAVFLWWGSEALAARVKVASGSTEQ